VFYFFFCFIEFQPPAHVVSVYNDRKNLERLNWQIRYSFKKVI
jgi:hypothetical protein